MYFFQHLSLLTVLFFMIAPASYAQSPSRLNCDPAFNPLVTQSYLEQPFTGQIMFSGSPESSLQITSFNGRERVNPSILRSGIMTGYYTSLSPDGRYMFNFPSSEENTLAVLDMLTGEIATIPLQEEEITALTEINSYPPANNPFLLRQRLKWVSSTEFIIRRLSLERGGLVFLFKQSFKVSSEPLSMIRGNRVDFALDQPYLEGSDSVANSYSPTVKYLVQVGLMKQVSPLVKLTRVINTQTQEVLITLPATGDSDFYTTDLWSRNENGLFVVKTTFDEITSEELYYIDLTVSPPQVSTQVWDDIEYLLGGDAALISGRFTPTVSPSGDKIAFKVRKAGEYQTDYLISYDLNTRDISVVCDNQVSSGMFIQTLWSPDERYVGYYEDRRHVLVVMDTHEAAIYSLPLTENDQQFLGWIP